MKKYRKAENFILKDQDGQDFELYKNLDNRVLLVFYPKDNSPVCSVQLKNYSDHLNKFAEKGIKIVAVNNGKPEDHSSFCRDKNLKITILSDADYKVTRQFSALYPFKITKRKLVLINRNKDIVLEKTLLPFNYWSSDKILYKIA